MPRLIGDPQKLSREEFDAVKRIERVKLIKRLVSVGFTAVGLELERRLNLSSTVSYIWPKTR